MEKAQISQRSPAEDDEKDRVASEEQRYPTASLISAVCLCLRSKVMKHTESGCCFIICPHFAFTPFPKLCLSTHHLNRRCFHLLSLISLQADVLM